MIKSFFTCYNPATDQPVFPIYGLGGQSNAEGRIFASDLSSPYSEPQPGVEIFFKPDGTSTDNGEWQTLYGGVNTSYRQEDLRAGIETFLAKSLKDYKNSEIGILKCAKFSSMLAKWNTTSREDWAPDSAGEMYQRSREWFHAPALAKLEKPFDLKCYIWIQGEADASTQGVGINAHTNYETNLTAYIDSVRALYQKPNLPFIIVGLNQIIQTNYPGYPQVRAAQEAIALADSNVFLIDTEGFDFQSDNLHYSVLGLQQIANAVFEVIKDF